MSPKISRAPAPVVSKPIEAPGAKKAPPAKSESTRGSDFSAPQKKPVNLRGTGKFKPVAKLDPALAELVGKFRQAMQAGGAKAVQAEVAQALKKIGPPAKDGLKQLEQLGTELSKLSPETRQKVWDALPPRIREAAIKSVDWGSNVDPSISMLRVQSMSAHELQGAAAKLRAGDESMANPGLQLAVATELAARTKWGKDNPTQIAHQRELVAQGKIELKNGRGMGRTKTDGTITLDSKLSKSPEAMAATLAHEAVHSAHATGWGMDQSVFTEETAGNLVSAQVWAELGAKDDPNLTKSARDTLNDYAEQFKAHGKEGVQARMAAEYAMEAGSKYAETSTPEEAAKVRDIIKQLGSNPGVVKAMKPEYALEITRGLLKLAREGNDVKELGTLFRNLPEAARKALPGMLAGLPAEAQKLLLAGLNG